MNHQNFISNITEISDNLFEMWLSDERSKRLEQDLIDLFWYDCEDDSFNLDYEEFVENHSTEISKDMYFENCFREKAKEWFYDRYNEIIYDFNQSLDLDNVKNY
jgi:hypothetical protein